MHLNLKKAALALFLSCLLSACSLAQRDSKLQIVEAKTASDVDEKLMPVKVAEAFPEGTSKVFCWFQWKDAKLNTEVTAKWHYVTDDIHILDYAFALPRKSGSGSVALAMPEGKKLPAGLYRLDLIQSKRSLKTITFKIE